MPGMASGSAPLLLACFLAGAPATAKDPKKNAGWRLPHHSFERTLTYDDTLNDWFASAGSIPLRDRLQIFPPVADRYGFFWARRPVKTKDFEVRFTLSSSASGVGQKGLRDGAFTFWLSPDNVAEQYDEQTVVSVKSKVWSEGLQQIGFTLLSNKPDFRGLALTFVDNGKPAIAALWNDGSKSRALADLTSSASGAQTKDLQWMTAGTQIKVRVTPDGAVKGSVMTLDVHKHIVGALWGFAQDGVNSQGMVGFQANGRVTWNDKEETGSWSIQPGNKLKMTLQGKDYLVRFEGSTRAVVEEPQSVPPAVLLYGGQDTGEHAGDWTELFSLPAGTMKVNEAFMGFSGYSGVSTFLDVGMHRLETINFDQRVMGEEDEDFFGDENMQWMEVLEREKKFVDQSDQAEAVLRLTQLLSAHVEKTSKEGDKLKETLMHLENKLDRVGTDMATYLSATRAYSFESDKFEPASLTSHIASIRDILTKSSEQHNTKMDGINKATQDMKGSAGGMLSDERRQKVNSVQDQAKNVEQFAAAGSSQANWMLLFMVLAVAGLGLLFLNRMRYYERKHYI